MAYPKNNSLYKKKPVVAQSRKQAEAQRAKGNKIMARKVKTGKRRS